MVPRMERLSQELFACRSNMSRRAVTDCVVGVSIEVEVCPWMVSSITREVAPEAEATDFGFQFRFLLRDFVQQQYGNCNGDATTFIFVVLSMD